MMHIIFFNTKGGVSKSTLCEFSSLELQRLGYSVHVDNTDQQEHVTLIENEQADFFLYDTAGAFTAANVDLLKAAADVKSLIVIPMNTGVNDLKELDFILARLDEFGVKDKSRIVFTKTRQNSKALQARKATALERGLIPINWVMPMLEDFSEQRDTSRTRNEISAFLHEVIL
ncbi:CobQ/CobB/MinD/ParA nucleotide binding domain-containing protein [Vibrio crassostreae]|jgi:chromosome partitioning protein|nr:chromosome partitioning protein [Vibrio crassostreae]TCT47711.1 chromosome partitioning protein [Vibrio crassostreae]CAK2104687.1 CobQ/CobB/MinD/ParA nucleotide binding domain-containing protein [Vibrio crassostreae]CAK2109285.1 CobQ/CobB/MinD/ParA nucleotide binding domain-containing protein [Vibrio crassostreae]CAK2109959.1 CobQ/CobB/MinD/ParA nucleotide binding domain-containing protein [Vibrio crassostreae]